MQNREARESGMNVKMRRKREERMDERRSKRE